jgi:plastocyanin
LRKLIVLAAVGATLVAAIPALAATKSVKVGDNYFVRDRGVPTVTVSKGTTVKWVFRGDREHNVRVTSGPVTFASPIKSSGSFKRKMGRKGTYRIICDLHGAGDQSMKLVVK